MLNYGYILPADNKEHRFSFLNRQKISCNEVYKTENNTLFFFYIPSNFNKKTAKKITTLLRQKNIEYIARHPSCPPISGIKIIDGSNLNKYLLVQAFFSYGKSKGIDIAKTGIHICADNINDIYFLLDKISIFNTVFSMNVENEKYHSEIFVKYGISVYFTNNITDKIILYLDGNLPQNKGCHIIDITNKNYQLSRGILPDFFTHFSFAEAELLIKMFYTSFDDGFYNSKIKILYY